MLICVEKRYCDFHVFERRVEMWVGVDFNRYIVVETFLSFLQLFYLSDSLTSQVLAHLWEQIERNGGYGLINYSEEPLEAKQGVARNLRNHNCFQENVQKHLEQCIQHMQQKGDTFINRLFFANTKNIFKIP